MNLFVFGLGYSTLAFIEKYRNTFVTISGTVRDGAKAETLAQSGINAFVWNSETNGGADIDELTAAIADADDVIISVPPGKDGDIVLKQFHHALRDAKLIRTILYLSTIGVYGNHDGAWVDEDTPSNPSSERGRQRLLAEKQWMLFARSKGASLHVLRLAGIYGPGRSAFDSLRNGKARRIIKPGQVFNRIHVEDIASAIAACLNWQHRHDIHVWNITDDEPSPPQDVIALAADMIGVDVPAEIAFDAVELSPMARSFYAENKRVSNARLKNELGVVLANPTYREGLAGLLKVTGVSSQAVDNAMPAGAHERSAESVRGSI
jgi:nucleoside-diphosphate-sugar epimerase